MPIHMTESEARKYGFADLAGTTKKQSPQKQSPKKRSTVKKVKRKNKLVSSAKRGAKRILWGGRY